MMLMLQHLNTLNKVNTNNTEITGLERERRVRISVLLVKYNYCLCFANYISHHDLGIYIKL